jgi:hypothetical protein
MTATQTIDDRIRELLQVRLTCARMPLEVCNHINDEIEALKIAQKRIEAGNVQGF